MADLAVPVFRPVLSQWACRACGQTGDADTELDALVAFVQHRQQRHSGRNAA